MAEIKSILRQLADHAAAKKAVTCTSRWSEDKELAPLECEIVTDPYRGFFEASRRGSSLPSFTFIDVDVSDGRWTASMPVLQSELEKHQERYPSIAKKQWGDRDGHVTMKVPIDDEIPVEFILRAIDDAYDLTWRKLDDSDLQFVAALTSQFNEQRLLDELISWYQLSEWRDAIHKVARPGLLLLTSETDEEYAPLGVTKIGGRPDLPDNVEWPRHSNGKPLAFLAQIDLESVARSGSPIRGLPKNGLMCVFSVWGWQTEEEPYPDLPHDEGNGQDKQVGWTKVLVVPDGAELHRRKTPDGIMEFKAATAHLVPVMSMPHSDAEPEVRSLRLPQDVGKRFDQMLCRYRALQMGHWLGSYELFASHHLLGGYAQFQMEDPPEPRATGLSTFVQIGSDGNADMMWCDGGELVFFADPKALAQGRFEHIWANLQTG